MRLTKSERLNIGAKAIEEALTVRIRLDHVPPELPPEVKKLISTIQTEGLRPGVSMSALTTEYIAHNADIVAEARQAIQESHISEDDVRNAIEMILKRRKTKRLDAWIGPLTSIVWQQPEN